MLHLVIMAGGSGTRFWPESRRARPKQFLTLAGDESLIQQAAHRVQPLIPAERTWVVTGALHAAETRQQLPEVPSSQVLLEPCARNTAPCLGLAALAVLQHDPDATLLVTPADHLIRPAEAFRKTVLEGAAMLDRQPQSSVLIGITPTYPAEGYGYIERGDEAGNGYQVARFREKPNRETAAGFLQIGDLSLEGCPAPGTLAAASARDRGGARPPAPVLGDRRLEFGAGRRVPPSAVDLDRLCRTGTSRQSGEGLRPSRGL